MERGAVSPTLRLYGPLALYAAASIPARAARKIEYFSSYVTGRSTRSHGSEAMSLPEEPFIRFAG
jgi:hypothetical protein